MVQPWRTLSSQRLLHDRWIDLRADRCVAEDGTEVAPYYVLSYPDWVHVVALTPDNRIVLVQQYRHGAGITTIELPGGGAEAGDADAMATGQRELREETGFEAAAWQHVSSLYPNPATQTNRVHTVLATGCVRVTGQRLDAGETGMTVMLSPVADILVTLAEGGLAQSMQVAGLLLALAKAGQIRL